MDASDLMQTSEEINPAMQDQIDDLRTLAARHGYKIVPMTVAEYQDACRDAQARSHDKRFPPSSKTA